LVDHDDLADVFDAGEAFDRAGLFLDGLAAFAEQVAMGAWICPNPKRP